jgi:two-component system, chemotaxis family, CheB/CheR fusion protein
MDSPSKKEIKLAEYIVGIGASAGGLEALQDFFRAMPENTGMGFVVIQHLSPDYKSLMDELLARHTRLRIIKVEDGMPVEPDTIYLIPPRKNLSVFHGKLILEDQGIRNRIILPVDIFFRSLAVDKEKKAIGVILSGTGSDGTLGTRAIKEAGGMIMVQDEATAKFDGMPRSSISTGLVDYILPPADMAEAIVNYTRHPFLKKKSGDDEMIADEGDSLSRIMLILRDYCGIDFSYYKENTIVRRLERRLNINRFDNLDDYIRLLANSEKEKDVLYRELLIGVTRFFRDEEAFGMLKSAVIPKLSDRGQKELRIWSVACSTGEEVYSLAMLIRDYIDENRLNVDVKIFATDIDKRSIAMAGQGYYPESILSDVDPALIAKYFVRRENGYQVGEKIRKMVIFATHNVLKDPPFSKLDLIVCRNLFIYFKPDSQGYVLNIFRLGLKPGGFLFMGSSETLGVYSEAFDVVSSKYKIYKRKATLSPGVQNLFPAGMGFLKTENRLTKPGLEARISKSDQLANQIIQIMLPPSVIIDENFYIIQIINDINPYIELRSGRFNQSLNNLISKELSALISNLIRRLKTEKEMVRFENVKLTKSGQTFKINLEGRFLKDEGNGNFLISFIEIGSQVEQADTLASVIDVEDQFRDQLSELQYELQYTKESLQATVEELETSNEELQASNEELMASNEELQSTNEELQSVNEELHTVNYEHQNKIEELTMLNNDVNNLLNNTGVAALYLDNKLRIRKYTPNFAKICKIMDFDIGRPLKDLATAYIYPDFMDDIESVQEKLRRIEKEVAHNDKIHYLLRIAPYRNDYNAVDGILITMVNICALHREREKLDASNNRLQLAMNMGNMAWWEWDVPSGNVSMHEKKATMLGYSPQDFPSDVYEISKLIHPDDYEHSMQQMRNHLEGKIPEYNVVYRLKTASGDYKWYHDRGGVVERTSEGKPLKLIGLVIDIDELKNLELKSGKN